MKYDHLVKHDGIYYKAGEEVPDGTSPKAETQKGVEETPELTKAQVMAMKKEELKTLSTEKGIEVPNGIDVAGAKDLIIKKLGL